MVGTSAEPVDLSLTIYTTLPDMSSEDHYLACRGMIRYAGLKYREVFDQATAMRVSKGKINPMNGFVIQTPEGFVLYDVFSLAQYIMSVGTVPM